MVQIGVTERGDASLSEDWVDWVYKKDKPAILITKNAPLLQKKHPDIFFKNVIIHVTCTGLGGTIFFFFFPAPDVIYEWIKNKPATLQRKLVLRVDPICPSLFSIKNDKFDGEEYWKNIVKLFNLATQFQLRCRISFLDYYTHVKERFKLEGIDIDKDYANCEYNGVHLSLEARKKWMTVFNTGTNNQLPFEICGEPGLPCTGCVSKLDLDILGLDPGYCAEGNQRLACKCLGIKKELLNNKSQCAHKCLYCYWKGDSNV